MVEVRNGLLSDMSYFCKFYRSVLCITVLILVSCKGNPPDLGDFTGKETVYLFEGESTYDVTGSILFQEKKDGSLLATIKLKNTTDGDFHSAAIYFGSVDDPGEVAVILEPVDGDSGESVTQFSELADTTPLNFEELLIFNGHIKIHQNNANVGLVLASTNIGQNSANNPNIN